MKAKAFDHKWTLSRHCARKYSAESAGLRRNQTLVTHAGEWETSWIADWLNFNLLMKSSNNPFLFPHPHLQVDSLKVTISVYFCVLMGQKCENVRNLKRQLSSEEKAFPCSPRCFYFLEEHGGRREKTLVSRNACSFGLLERPVGALPKQKFRVPWVPGAL